MVLSGFVGGVASYVTSPFALIAIRQIIDSQTKPEWRRNYGSTSQAIEQLKKEGSLWKGSWQNVLRHVLLNVSITGPYDYVREAMWTRFGDYYFVQPVALLCAALFSSAVTLPFDNIRTRIMNLHSEPDRNRLNYNGALDVIVKSTLFEQHPLALWAGYVPYFLSILVYSGLTIGITSLFTDSWKKKRGLD